MSLERGSVTMTVIEGFPCIPNTHTHTMRMQEAQLSHIRRSMESERARSAAGAARARATELQTQALQLLQETYRDPPDGQQEALELAK